MTADPVLPAWHDLTTSQAQRWEHVLGILTIALSGVSITVVDSDREGLAEAFADRLAFTARRQGRHCVRLTPTTDPAEATLAEGTLAEGTLAEGTLAEGTLAVAVGQGWRSRSGGQDSTVIWLRTAPDAAADRDRGAAVVVDLHDRTWPVIRRISPALAGHDLWYLTESQAFFGTRAATWDSKYGDDMPAYAAAIADASITSGGVAIDLGCGTGRALPALRAAVGHSGIVIGIDHTREMLEAARASGRARAAMLIQADARHLPLRDSTVDAIFAAGLITHLPDVHAGLCELARVTKPGGILILFHPSGRAALAARHRRHLVPGDRFDSDRLTATLHAAGWHLTTYDDPPHRFLAIAERQ